MLHLLSLHFWRRYITLFVLNCEEIEGVFLADFLVLHAF